jgi:hypothetical protein
MNRRPVRNIAEAHDRAGVIAVLVALSLLIILGIAALTLDGGLMFDKRRQVTAAAEASATAAAYQMFHAINKAAETGKPLHIDEINQSAIQLAREIASENGYANDGVRSTVNVNIPPASGSYVGKEGYVEVVVHYTHARTFSSIFGRAPLTVKGRAVACGTYIPTRASILVLDPKKKEAAKFEDANLELKGDLIVNSKDKHAIKLKKKAQVTADNILVVGGIDRKSKDNTLLEGEISTNVKATPDPLAELPAPPKGVERNLEDYLTTMGKQRYFDLEPGVYKDKLHFGKDDVVHMNPGTYYIEKDGLKVSGHSSLYAEGVMLYNASKKEMKFETDGSVFVSPQESGPYAGISLFQGDKGKIKFRNDMDLQISGTVYAPKSEVRFQKIDAVLGEIPDDPEGSEDDEVADDDSDSGGSETHSTVSIQVIANRFKIDKKSHVKLTGNGIDAFRPFVGIVE